jgi:hypothetical protein
MRRVMVIVAAVALLAGCDVTGLILSPPEGAIVPIPTVTVSGELPASLTPGGTLTVNGIATPIASDGTWTADVPAAPGKYVTPIVANYRDPRGVNWTEKSAVVNGPKLDEGQPSPDGVGMRFTNTGLAGLGPIVENLAAGAFDIGGLLLAQNPIIDEENAFLTIDVTGNAYDAGIGGVDLGAASTSTGVATHITISDLFVGVNLHLDDGLLIDANCGLELQIPTTAIDATFDLAPGADPSFVDVNLVGVPAVDTGSVNYEFISGICDGDTFLIGDIVNLVAGPQIETLVGQGFATKLGDPDGAGPADSPIADAIETALAQVSIAGAVGEAVKVNLAAPFTQITEGASAIDFRANADFFTTVGAGPSDCQPPTGAPDLASTFDVPGSFPALGDTTPGGDAYGLGLVISASAFNQLLGSMAECGILNQSVHEISLGGTPVPITSTVLAALVPQFGTKLPPNTPLRVEIDPTVGPFLTSRPGPGGAPSELVLANLRLAFVQDTANGPVTWLALAVDAPLGFDLEFDAGANQLSPVITAPAPADVDTRVMSNAVGANAVALETLFPQLFPSFVGDLSASFAAFPLPAFLGLSLDVLEVARQENSFVLYANLNPIPQTRIENVALTDLSSGDSVTDSILDVNEWRHRIRRTVSSNQIRIDFDGMVGADACCFADDESRAAHAGYRLTFGVVREHGETWRLDLSQLIQGAHTLLDEQGGSASTTISAVTGRARVGTGAFQNFDFTPTVTSRSSGSGAYAPFTGGNSLVLQGDTAQPITVEFEWDVQAFSDSTTSIIPPIAVAGDEAAIRFGANDTIVNGFTAGEYPGVGSRNIVTDGHVAVVGLTTVP